VVFYGFDKFIFSLELCLACFGDLIWFENWVFLSEVCRFCSLNRVGDCLLDLFFDLG